MKIAIERHYSSKFKENIICQILRGNLRHSTDHPTKGGCANRCDECSNRNILCVAHDAPEDEFADIVQCTQESTSPKMLWMIGSLRGIYQVGEVPLG